MSADVTDLERSETLFRMMRMGEEKLVQANDRNARLITDNDRLRADLAAARAEVEEMKGAKERLVSALRDGMADFQSVMAVLGRAIDLLRSVEEEQRPEWYEKRDALMVPALRRDNPPQGRG